MSKESNIYKLNFWRVYEITGPDAKRYLQGRLSQDINSLKSGELKESLMLSPQGKIQQMPLVALSSEEESYYLICYFGSDVSTESENFKNDLFQFKVADLVEIKEKDCELLFSENKDELNQKSRFSYLDLGCFILRSDNSSSESLLERAFLEKLTLWGKPLFLRDLKTGSQAGLLELKNYVSFEKGCYAGQEVVEKTEALGKAARKIFRISSKEEISALKQGAEVCDFITKEKIGELTSVFSPSKNEHYALANLKTKELPKDSKLEVDNKEWTVLS